MKVTQEKLPASQIGLQIEISPEVSQQAYDKALQKFMRTASIPGFRKGKVPRQVLIQRFGSSQIKATVIEELVQDSLLKALEQEKIEAIGNFQLRSSFDELLQQFEPGSALTFSAAVDVFPEATVSQYKGLTVQAEEVSYDESRVDSILEGYQSRMATLVPVEDRPAQEGDIAVVDFVGRLQPEEGSDAEPEEFAGGSANDFQVELSEGRFIPGFVEGIVGMQIDDTKEIETVFPEDYPQADLAGQPVVFTVTVKELKTRELPELDDDFAQEVSEFETLAEFRESLEKRYQEEASESTRFNKEKALLNELVKYVEADVPETLIQQEVDQMLTQTAMSLANQGIDIKQMFTRELVQRLREQSRPDAIAQIQRQLAIQAVADQESITVTDDEIQAKMQEIIEESGQDPASINTEKLEEIVQEDLLREKVVQFLEENGRVELVPEGSLEADDEADEAIVDEVELAEGTEEDGASTEVETTAEVIADEPDAEPVTEEAAPAEEEASSKKKTKSKSSKK
jgi:trigger factor